MIGEILAIRLGGECEKDFCRGCAIVIGHGQKVL